MIVNQKCYNMDNPEDDGDMIHMCPPWFAGNTKKMYILWLNWVFYWILKIIGSQLKFDKSQPPLTYDCDLDLEPA